MLAPHPYLAHVLVRLAGQNVALQRLCSYPRVYPEQVDGRAEEVGHADTSKTMADSRPETDLSSIQTTEQRPILFSEFSGQDGMICMRKQTADLSETKAANAQEWALIID